MAGSLGAASSSHPSSAEDLLIQTKLQEYIQSYPDYPKNFVHPALTHPHYVPPDTGDHVIEVAVITTSIALIVGTLRLYTRSTHGGKLRPDDWFIIPGILFSLSLAVLQITTVRYGGMGKHIYDIEFSALELCLKLQYAHIILYYVTLTVIKTSILLFTHELAPISNRPLRSLIKYFIAFLWVWLGVCCLASTFDCKPAAATFDLRRRVEGSECRDIASITLGLNAVLAVTDIIIVVLPAKIVWNLQLPRRRKLGIIFLFSLGLLSCVGCIMKMMSVKRVYSSYDFTWYSANTLMWSQVEGSLAIIIASLPSLNALFLKISNWAMAKLPNTKNLSQKSGERLNSEFGIEIQTFADGNRSSSSKMAKGSFKVLPSTPDRGSIN